MPFVDALNAANVPPDLRAVIDTLVERRKAAEELDEGAAVPVINQFIDTELARLPVVADAMPESRGSLRDRTGNVTPATWRSSATTRLQSQFMT